MQLTNQQMRIIINMKVKHFTKSYHEKPISNSLFWQCNSYRQYLIACYKNKQIVLEITGGRTLCRKSRFLKILILVQ